MITTNIETLERCSVLISKYFFSSIETKTMEAQLVSEFLSRAPGANPNDALSCLNSWGWDLKKALIDYNDTSTTDYFNGKAGLKVSMDTVDYQSPQTRKPLTKLDSIDIADYKKLYRGISKATENVNLVSRARSAIEMDFHANCVKQLENFDVVDTPDFTFTLPDISIYSDDFRRFLEKDLIECSTLNSLESAQRLNWWADCGFCRRLWPLATSGDGNCLLHAASLAMWGFHDRKLTLRSALHKVLFKGEYRDAIWRRWRFQQTRLNKNAGFVYSEIEWAKEWEEIVAMASPEPRHSEKGASRRRSVVIDRNSDAIDDNATYESLEEIHIFALSHVLRRAIIVVADTVLRDMNGEAMAPIPFGGIYLPFEIPANECHRAPLLLTYDMAHFSALVSMESSDPTPSLIPLVDYENIFLPIQFCIDPGDNFDWRSYDGNQGNWGLTDREHIALLKEYLDIVWPSPLGSPDDEIFDDLTDEEYEKRIGEGDIAYTDEQHANGANGKSKAAKQLQSVAKQFGSIGKSMSKKFKKNIGSITKIGGGSKGSKKGSLTSAVSTQSFTRQRILCAQLKAKRHDYQEEMIKNYLECAQDRFLDGERTKDIRDVDRLSLVKPKETIAVVDDYKTGCINSGCKNFGTAATSYMCQECFEKQKQQELDNLMAEAPRYGTGNSKFYAQSDSESHQLINRLPSVRRLNELDQTLYLSNSTFYNDNISLPDKNSGVNSSSFRHGYCVKDSNATVSPPLSDYDLMKEGVECLRQTSMKNPQLVAASFYSPGKTTIHTITRQTVNLPPTTVNQEPNKIRNTLPLSGTSFGNTTEIPNSNVGRLPTPFTQMEVKKCQTSGCMFYGNVNTNYYCSKCCQLNAAATKAPSATSQTKILTTDV
ncbi:OTU domain-containing protein 7B [Pseudolycoriella hygida]|uniref:ubiquitinyl hydrolase 1 n=1 Tax=Pseudolycoriella hygida TaxID=35572 RepID=A0A9Q0MQV1_9DIPT|nr:OTU domain-containing protein 7B [Pseudolycoriella hygida]